MLQSGRIDHQQAAAFANVHPNTVSRVFDIFDHVGSWMAPGGGRNLVLGAPLQLQGQQVSVEVDEIKIMKRKYNVGQLGAGQQLGWLLHMVQRNAPEVSLLSTVMFMVPWCLGDSPQT